MEWSISRRVLRSRPGIPSASISRPRHTTDSRSENLWHWSGGDWGIGHAETNRKRERWDSQRSLIPNSLTLGAMNMGVKRYIADPNRSTILAGCDARDRADVPAFRFHNMGTTLPDA